MEDSYAAKRRNSKLKKLEIISRKGADKSGNWITINECKNMWHLLTDNKLIAKSDNNPNSHDNTENKQPNSKALWTKQHPFHIYKRRVGVETTGYQLV